MQQAHAWQADLTSAACYDCALPASHKRCTPTMQWCSSPSVLSSAILAPLLASRYEALSRCRMDNESERAHAYHHGLLLPLRLKICQRCTTPVRAPEGKHAPGLGLSSLGRGGRQAAGSIQRPRQHCTAPVRASKASMLTGSG